jgi:hypothetical protein
MKKTLLFTMVIAMSIFSYAQDLETKKKELAEAKEFLTAAQAKVDAIKAQVAALKPPVIWTKGQSTGVSFSSLGLTNWVAGGVSSNAISTFGNVFRNYKKDKIEWVNNLDMSYGFIQNDGENIRKNDDRIDLLSKVGYGISKKMNVSALINFKTQFAPGYDFTIDSIADEDRQAISKFLAPATLVASLGLDYKANKNLSIYLSPATSKFTIVQDDSIATARTYIPGDKNDNGDFYYNQNFRPELGFFFNATFNTKLTDRVGVKSTLDLFNNITDANKDNRLNTDVDWITDITAKITKHLDARIYTNLKYDHNQVLATETALGNGPQVQFQRLFGLGFNYKF